MVIRYNRKMILPTVIVALAFSNTLKNITAWLYPIAVMSLFLCISIISLVKRNSINSNERRIKRAFQVIKYGFIPYLIIYLYSVVVIKINGNFSSLFLRATGSCFSAMSVALIVAAIVYLYGAKSVNLMFNGMLLEYFIELLFGFAKVGISGFIEHLIDPLNTYQSVFERHDIGFALFLFLIYYILYDAHSNKAKIIILLFVEYMIMKRIAIVGFIVALIVYFFVTWITKKKENKKYKICFFLLYVSACLYLNFVINPYFKTLTMEYGIYNRFLFVDAMRNFYSISLRFLGQGYGFVSVILPKINFAGVTGIAALHNDILKDFIELGFVGFYSMYFYLFVYMPVRLFINCKKKIIKIALSLMTYMLITLLTDNVFEYIAFMGSLMIILSSLKIEDEERVCQQIKGEKTKNEVSCGQ